MIEWFDDLTSGVRFKSGEVSVSKEDIKRFAAEFDPQPFHLDKHQGLVRSRIPEKRMAEGELHREVDRSLSQRG